jgi:heptaprenyl diphosphate synthase
MNADRLARHLHPTVRFFWGLGLLCCLVFSGGWEARTLLAVMGLTLALLSGKRVSFGYFAFLIASVVVFNLFLPLGKLWFQIGPWAVTDGAFFLGLGKAMTFAGLVFFSLASISRHLRLPGRLGSLWGQTFAWYEQLMDQRRALKPRALLMSIDRLLEQLYPTRPGNQVPVRAEEKETRPDRTTVIGWVLVGLTWIPAFIVALVLK